MSNNAQRWGKLFSHNLSGISGANIELLQNARSVSALPEIRTIFSA
ncbi:MAG: hypothetical protein U5L01_04995 [Rheinheimera sp.]|nr:hypothetical protein [Rheinheimera sp.]